MEASISFLAPHNPPPMTQEEPLNGFVPYLPWQRKAIMLVMETMNAQPFTGTGCTTQAVWPDSLVSWISMTENMTLREPDSREFLLGRVGISAQYATVKVQNQAQSRPLEANILGQDSRQAFH